jgi:hypothetical protein
VTGRWSPTPKLAYQWLLDARPIRDATGPILVVLPAYADRRISLRVTARHSGYVTREAVSDVVAIRRGSMRASVPRIRGDARIGETLHLVRGDWGPQPEFSYRWLVDGHAVEGRSTGIAYKVRPQDRGKRITVEVTGRSHGYASVTRLSPATPRVRP